MPSANKPGWGVVPSARSERRRALLDDASGIVLYAAAVALIFSFIIAIVVLA